jgi:D-aspartate ligase
VTLKIGNQDFIPVVFAADINVYSLARAYHEAYGIRIKAYGTALSGPLHYTCIADYDAHQDTDNPKVLRSLLQDFAADHPAQKILPIGCGDNYVQAIAIAAEEGLPENVCQHYMKHSDLLRYAHKQNFYALCDQEKIAHPKTFVYSESFGGRIDIDFQPPFIVKPSDGVSWWRHPFENQRKVHIVSSVAELKTLLSAVYAAKYDGEVIVQEYIDGPDSDLYVLTQYIDSRGVLTLSASGRVLAEEHTPKGVGNSVVIVSEPHGKQIKDTARQLGDLLLKNGYRGFASFDLKYDQRQDCLKVLEVNTRQGRGNYYVTGSGANIARFITEDLVYQRAIEPVLEVEPYIWSVLPEAYTRRCVGDADNLLHHTGLNLMGAGRWGNPLDYKADKSLMRQLWLKRYERLQVSHYEAWKKLEDNNSCEQASS